MGRIRHLPYLVAFAILAAGVTRPLTSVFTTGVLGPPGDNLSFVWDFWWAQTAVATHQAIFWTPALFAPIGTSLATHTLVPLLSVGAAIVFPHASPPVLYNGALLLSVFLNFACAYAAACTLTGDRAASAFAAITFGAAPFLLVRAIGHLNVLSAWGLPLVLALAVRYGRRPGLLRALLLAVGLAAVAYTDYYYFIFGSAMAALWLALPRWTPIVRSTPLTPPRRRAAWAMAALLGAIFIVLLLIAATGGADISAAGVRIRMTDTFNGRVIAGFLAMGLVLVWTWPSVRLRQRPEQPSFGRMVPSLAAAAGTLAVLLAPILLAGVRVWRAGDYSSQVYVWRNAPPGIDLASLILGNQLHPAIGGWTRAAYDHFGINGIEGAAWLGIVPTILVVLAWRLRGRANVANAFWVGGFFLLWAFGPYLRVFNFNTGLMLPQTLLRFVPIAANARIPGRAFAVVQLMAAVLGAAALSQVRSRAASRAIVLTTLAMAGVLVDYWPLSRAATTLSAPSVYAALRHMPEGSVLPIPIGMHDGFSQRGLFDNRLLYYQTIHGHPIMGGAISRISARTTAAYERDPIVGALLDLSEGRASAERLPDGCAGSLACSARYLIVDEGSASPELRRFASAAFPEAALVARDGATALYALKP